MKPFLHQMQRWIGLALLLGIAAGLAGCGTVEGDAKNMSARPWNTPKYWEGGLPTSLNEGR
jgi:hypothetical protein